MVAPFLNVFLFHRLVAGVEHPAAGKKSTTPLPQEVHDIPMVGNNDWEPLIYIVYIPINGWELGTMIYIPR